MVAAPAPSPATQKVAYKSPKHAQVWFLKRSRDLWKKKYQHLKAQSKRWQNRVADVTKSRATWRARAEEAERRLEQWQRQHDAPQALLPSPREKKGQTSSPR
jgi:chromosome segregation ATPase